ncbi:MAG TPA: fibronectin type III domain-containing protein [Acidobacteriaceae bacterium]|nr:fibronectin type III domain-containing protein [Acidobacteriaceae bacterium]
MSIRSTAARRTSAMAAALPWAMLLAGCGLAENPQPPTLWLPQPVKDLAATRVSNTVRLHWTMPKNTTDKVALKGDQRAQVCWEFAAPTGKPAFDAKNCRTAGDGMFPPDKPADLAVPLPDELTTGKPRAVAFYVELQNHVGKTAGPSNPAWVASGPAPLGVAGLQLETRAEGVVLRWAPATPEPGLIMRLHRTLVLVSGAPKPDEAKGVSPPAEQTLEVSLDHQDPGGAVDRDAALDHTWKYWVERVVRIEADGHAIETAGPPSAAVTIDAKDVFPPAVPAGLAIVADPQGKAMDLSWTPDTDADTAGYFVYRMDLSPGAAPASAWERITPKVVVAPSYTDTTVLPGHSYAFAVSAVDQDGNESAKSPEVQEQMPQ